MLLKSTRRTKRQVRPVFWRCVESGEPPLCRLRRATTIDTGLLRIVSDIDHDSDPSVSGVVQIGQIAPDLHDHEKEQSAGDFTLCSVISKRFLRLDPGAVEWLGRYETALWRQVYQVIFVLDFLRRQNLDLKWLPPTSSSVGRFRPLRSLFPKGSGATYSTYPDNSLRASG